VVLFIQHRSPLDSIFGYLSFTKIFPKMVRDRQRILSKRKLTDQEIDRLLILSPEGISLPRWLSRRIRPESL
jgi:hypothetical protein